jgi:hypothetical protein
MDSTRWQEAGPSKRASWHENDSPRGAVRLRRRCLYVSWPGTNPSGGDGQMNTRPVVLTELAPATASRCSPRSILEKLTGAILTRGGPRHQPTDTVTT